VKSPHYLVVLRRGLAVLAFGGLGIFSPTNGQEPPPESLTINPDEIASLPVFPVWGMTSALPEARLPVNFAPILEQPQLAEAITGLPNLSVHRRGGQAIEPNIRGQAFDRVSTSLDGLLLPNASPTRTASPLAQFGRSTATNVLVHHAPASLALGPPNLGGLIVLSLDPYPNNTYNKIVAPEGIIRLYHDANMGGLGTAASIQGSGRRLDYRLSAFSHANGDYPAADGRVVANDLQEWGVALHLGIASGSRQRTTLGVFHRHLVEGENIALPLDNKRTTTLVLTGGHVIAPAQGPFKEIRLGGGYGTADPFLTNEDRPPPPPFLIEAFGRAETASGRAAADLTMGPTTLLTIGTDYHYQRRNTVRFAGSRPPDHIWPNVVHHDWGGYVESSTDLNQATVLQLGVRIDQTRSDARSADELAFGQTVREQYVRFNGPAAAQVDREDLLFSANARLTRDFSPQLSAYGGVGLTNRAPDTGQRYRALLSALGGGMEIGNPTLEPETQWSTSAGLNWRTEKLLVGVDIFAQRVEGYIIREPVGRFGPNPVFGYRPADAEFYGGEVGAIWRPIDHVEIPLSFGITRGRNTDADREIAEIPPWELSSGLRLNGTVLGRVSRAVLGFRHVASRVNPDPVNAPIFRDTDSFTLWHLRVEVDPMENLTLRLGIENLWDEDHYEYLTPPVGGPVPAGRPGSGDLRAGDAIPGPGRTVYAAAEWRF